MDHKRPVKIGNENFKQWLRELHPGSRVGRMSTIAKTLSKMGQRASEIKAALAQLSQRCQVMLVRLTEKEIEHYIRRKPLKRLQNLTTISTPVQHQGSRCKLIESWNVKEHKLPQNGTDIIIPPKCYDESFRHYESSKSSSILFDSTPKKLDSMEYKSVDSPRKKQKKKELMRQLFGDDSIDDITCEKVQNTSNGTNDNKVNNYLSTTVNVNIFNATVKSTLENNTSITKRKSHTEKAFIKSNTSSNKRLRIDVSLSDNDSTEIRNRQFLSGVQPINDSNYVEIQKDRKNKLSPLRKNSGKFKKKPSKSRQKSNKSFSLTKSANSPEEDSAIRELWSILGMESPTERTAKFLSTPINDSLFDSITTQSVSEIANKTDELGNVHHLSNSASISTNGPAKNPDMQKPAQSSDNTEPENTPEESFIKISETFSLAETSSKEQNDLNDTTYNPLEGTTQISFTRSDEENMQDKESDDGKGKANKSIINNNAIETIFLDDDNNEIEAAENPQAATNVSNQETDQANKSGEEKSKIGTIRVKSWVALANPQLQQNTNENMIAEPDDHRYLQSEMNMAQTANVQDQDDSTSNVETVEERFYSTYTYYFDELTESKIPKLGELLHLAIADAIRRDERIKRTEQLSCEDLLKEEKQRAEKKFIDSMKLRGVEFSPLCDVIVKRFEKGSKITLFLALFCRILKHAGTIDPENEKHILQARKVISLMLKKSQYKDKDILDELQSNDFTDQANRVRELIEKCIPAKIAASSPLTTQGKSNFLTNTNKESQVKVNPAPAVTEERDIPNSRTITLSGKNLNRICMQMISQGKCNQLINGQSKTGTTIKKIGNLLHVSLKNIPAKPNVVSNIQKLVMPSGTQQPPMHLQSNVTPDKIILLRETPYTATQTKTGNATSTIEPMNNQPTALVNQRLKNTMLGEIQRQSPNKTNTINNMNNLVGKNNFNIQPRPQQAVNKVNNPLVQNPILTHQLMLPARSKTTQDIRNSMMSQQQSTTCATSQVVSETGTSTVSRNSPTQIINNLVEHLTKKNITTNFGNTLQISKSVQQSSAVTSALAESNLGSATNTLPGTRSVSIDQQQKSNINIPKVQQSRRGSVSTDQQQPNLNPPVTSLSAPIIVRNVTPPVFQLRMAKLPDDKVSTSPVAITAAGDMTPPTVLEVETPSTSRPSTQTSPEVTSPTAEVNLPSSSHCHPFIARRPISSKLKMFFGNN